MNDSFQEKLEGLDLDSCWDAHAHLLGVGDGGSSGIFMKKASGLGKPFEAIRQRVFKHYTKSLNGPTDDSYLDHFGSCASNVFPGFKSLAFAFTGYHDDQGIEQRHLSDFIIPNEWSKHAAKKYESLVYVASIHPKVPNALELLEEAKKDGAVAIKWLPCADNINPSSKDLVPFYEKLRDLKLPLITHAGAEHAVKGEQFDQGHGNPLLLRKPLECGVKVIVAHCATDGKDMDYEESKRLVPSFNLFKRLMDTKEYDGLMYADISATPQINRAHWLPILLQRDDWHPKLLHGSDYPLPALPILFNLKWLELTGLLAREDARELGKVKFENPLLFDFMLKRSLNYKGHKFSASVFETKKVFDCALALENSGKKSMRKKTRLSKKSGGA